MTEPAAASYPHNSLAGIAGQAKRSRPVTAVLPERRRATTPLSPSAPTRNPVASSPFSDIRSATISGNDALSRRQWKRALRCRTISKTDILVCNLSTDSEHFLISDHNANLLGTIARAPSTGRALSAMSSEPQDMTNTINEYIEQNRARLEAEGADVPERLRDLLLTYRAQFKNFPDTLPELDPELLQRIHLTEGPPPASRPYRLSAPQLASCKEQLDKLLSAGLSATRHRPLPRQF